MVRNGSDGNLIGIVASPFCQTTKQLILPGLHDLCLIVLNMIITEKMKEAVH